TDAIDNLHRAREPFVDLGKLRRFAAEGKDIYEALRVDKPPSELRALLDTVAAMLRPVGWEQVQRPTDSAALLLAEMGGLDQDELRPVRRETKNRIQEIVTVYRGSLNASMSRVGQVFKEAVRRNSAALIVVHDLPSLVTGDEPGRNYSFRTEGRGLRTEY